MQLSFIDPGRFRTEFVLERLEPAPDGIGGFIDAWTATATVMAAIAPVRATVSVVAERRESEVTHTVTLRHRADLESGMRLSWAGRFFDISSAHDPDETGRYLVCRVREEGR